MNDQKSPPLFTFSTSDFSFVGTVEDFIGTLHDRSLAPAVDDRAFMQELAERVKMMSGYTVRTDDPMDFVEDLAKAGVVQIAPAPIGVGEQL